MKNTVFALLGMLLLSCSMTAQGAENTSSVMPLPAGVDTEALEEGGSAVFAAEFTIADFYLSEDGTPGVRMDVYEKELFDLVDISLLEEGDTILLGGDSIVVETLERDAEGAVIINGGLEADGGYVLRTDEDTVYYEADADGNPKYQKVGEVSLALDGNFILVDYTENDDGAAEYTWDDISDYEQAEIRELSFSPDDTEVTVENGLVTNITRKNPDIEEDTDGNEVPYTIRILRNDLSVFDGPGYDYSYSAVVWSSGTYTIVQEESDEEGNLWGKLKSGIGWVDLAEAVSESAAQMPVTAVYADEQMLEAYNCVEYLAADSQQMVKVAFRSNETLKDISFSLLEISEDGSWKAAEECYTLSELAEGTAFVAGIEFYGDMTAYGISFTDADGTKWSFAVHISGRNGELLLDEYE
ncbi:MAG: hypothetical protein LUD18_02215 [Lachnospiraceae bacterium]|nr:hypothetical protein [Lachnospiraceae bacterium]